MVRSNRIRHIVRLTQMMKRWRKKVSSPSKVADGRVPSDVPPGHVAVSVGSGNRRFIVRASHLNHPVFRNLLCKAEEEFGFANNDGPLFIPCDELAFEEALRVVTRSINFPSRCRVTESMPLLYGFSEKPLC